MPLPRPALPPKFGGEPHKLTDWLQTMNLYFERFPQLSEREKALFAGDCMLSESVAQKAYMRWLAQKEGEEPSWDSVQTMLKDRFRNMPQVSTSAGSGFVARCRRNSPLAANR